MIKKHPTVKSSQSCSAVMYMNFVMESKVVIIHREIDVCSGSENHPWEDVMKVQIIIHWKI